MIIPVIIIIFSGFANPASGLVGALLVGVWYDVWYGRDIGSMAFILLLMALLVNMYKRKFNAKNSVFLVVFSVISVTIYTGIRYQSVFFDGMGLYVVYAMVVSVITYSVFAIMWRIWFTEKNLSV